MRTDLLAADLIYQHRIGFPVGQIEVYGMQLVRPNDLVYELQRVEAPTSDLLKLTFVINPTPGMVSMLTELVLEDPGQFTLTEDAIVFPSARYLRFEERTFLRRDRRIETTDRGAPGPGFAVPAGPALVLR
jgi:hypothetical protein